MGDPAEPGSAAAGAPARAGTSVLVSDEQAPPPAHDVDARRWEGLAAAVVGELGARGDVELSLRFVGPEEMAELNERFMGHDGPTDVLSFPIDPIGGPDDVDPAGEPVGGGAPRLLGDVVICPEVAARNAPGHAGSYEDEVALLLVHGLLHVFGMDHADPAGRAQMWDRERELLARFHGPLARDPWGPA